MANTFRYSFSIFPFSLFAFHFKIWFQLIISLRKSTLQNTFINTPKELCYMTIYITISWNVRDQNNNMSWHDIKCAPRQWVNGSECGFSMQKFIHSAISQQFLWIFHVIFFYLKKKPPNKLHVVSFALAASKASFAKRYGIFNAMHLSHRKSLTIEAAHRKKR